MYVSDLNVSVSSAESQERLSHYSEQSSGKSTVAIVNPGSKATLIVAIMQLGPTRTEKFKHACHGSMGARWGGGGQK